MAFQTVSLGRPQGASDAEQLFTTALHTSRMSRASRKHDFWLEPEYFITKSEQIDEPLGMTLEREVEAAAGNEIPDMLNACLEHKEIYVKPSYGRKSTHMKKVYDDVGASALVHARWDRKVYDGMFGPLEQKTFAAGGSTRDETPSNTALNPVYDRMLHASEMIADYSFSMEDVFASIIPTDEQKVQDIAWISDKTKEEMSIRQELADIGVVDVKTGKDTYTMKELAVAVRYSEQFSRDTVRLSVIDMWVDFVIIRGRNAIRNEGLRMAATGAPTKSLTDGYSLKTLRKIDFHFLDVYPMTLGVMSLDTFTNFDQPLGAASSASDTDTSENLRTRTLIPVTNYSLLNSLSMNTDIGVVKSTDDAADSSSNGVFLEDARNRVLQISGDYCMDLHVFQNQFRVKTTMTGQTMEDFLTSVKVEYVPVFKQKDARVVHTIS